MGIVVPFPQVDALSAQVRVLKVVSDQIDQVLLQAMYREGLLPHELVALLAHRLGHFMRHVDCKSELWKVCEKVLREQAQLMGGDHDHSIA